jgi:hypothetical protein
VAELTAATATTVYTVTTNMDSNCDIFITNKGKGNASVNIALVDGLAASLADEDYIVYKKEIQQNKEIKIEGVNLTSTQSVVAYSDIPGVTVGVYGVEQDQASTSDGYPLLRKITSQSLAYGDFTDNEDATGYIDVTTQLPAGALPLGFKAVVTTGFTGDTTATIQVGVATDLDRFSLNTDQSVLAAASVGSLAATDGADGMNAAQTIRVTVTGGADFTSISAGVMTVEVYYIATA